MCPTFALGIRRSAPFAMPMPERRMVTSAIFLPEMTLTLERAIGVSISTSFIGKSCAAS